MNPGRQKAQRAQKVHRPGLFSFFLAFLICACVSGRVMGAEYLTPNDVVLPSETAAQETVAQSAGKASLRVGGLDVFPHAAAVSMYDDNVLITHTDPISDVEWSLLPGLTVVVGDVSTAFPGSVTLEQLRDLLSYSLVTDQDKPSRFVGIDFTPSINFFTEHSEFNNVDYNAGMTAGYTFSKLSLALDQDFARVAIKDNEIGDRVTKILFDTKLKARYQLTDRTLFEVDGRFVRSYYGNSIYQGYSEFRNEDWVDRRIGGKLDLGVGAAFGWVYPDVNPNQTYQQALVRGLYQLSGKLDVRSYFGVEVREYDGGISDTVDPVFNVALIYQFRPKTTFTLEAHRQDQPSPEGYYNYKTLGFSCGVKQKLFQKFSASLSAGYDGVDYVQLSSAAPINRSDHYYSVRAQLDYEVDRHFIASLFYIYQADSSNIERYTYTDNMVGLRVGWRY